MAFENLILLAPCHGIEDFPLYHTGDDAASLLACWTSLWHPSLLAGAKKLPRVERCDYPPEDLTNSLFVVPKPCEFEMSEELPDEIEAAGSLLIRGDTVDRSSIVQTALAALDESVTPPDEIVRDFFAFGFALLQVELLTQQMRYSSSVDQSRIERLLFDAAACALSGEPDTCREKLVACHDALADERSHYYPVDVLLVDLTLLVDSVLRPSIAASATCEVPANILAAAETMEVLQAEHPATCAELKQAVENAAVGLAGGEYSEQWLPLMSPDSALRQFKRGRTAWQSVVGQSPKTFGRRLSGIYPSLGHALRCGGFESALHMKFDEGKYPESSQSKTNWCVNDVNLMPSLARQPLNANAHDTFLDLPRELSDAMDTDFIAVRAFWHWPGYVVPWYEDLRRACQFGTALGKFVTLDNFFKESAHATANDSFSASNYRYPYLGQAAASTSGSTHSRWIEYWQRTVQAIAARGSVAMARVLGAESPDIMSELELIEQRLDTMESNRTDTTQLGELLTESGDALAKKIATESQPSTKTVINPFSFARRILVTETAKNGSLSAWDGANVYASAVEDGKRRTLVDVPAMGFASIHSDGSGPTELEGPTLADGMTLCNEFFHAVIDDVTGALRSLRDHGSRKTRVSQQVGMRITVPKTGQHWIDRQAPVAYSVMAADRAEITANGRMFAEITTAGRMLAPNGELVGDFVQRFQVTRGSRILQLEIEIEPKLELLLESDPWNSYYASRIAFGDETAVLVAGRHLQSQEVSSRRIEAPLFVDIDTPKHKTTIFSDGLPFHRRATDSQLDTLLVTGQAGTHGNETPSTNLTFHLGIGVDVPNPTIAALAWMSNKLAPMIVDGKAATPSGWFFHVTAKNVLVSSWDVVEEGAIQMRLVETIGRRTKFKLPAFRQWKKMRRVSIDGTHLSDVEISDGVAELTLAPFEIVQLLGNF